MGKLFDFMNNKFAPIANKISKNIIVSSIQDGIMTILPLILVGSIVTVVSLLNELFPNLVNLSKVSDYSFGMVAIGLAFLIPYNIMEKSKIGDKKLLTAVTSAALFMMLIAPLTVDEGYNGKTGLLFAKERFGATGLLIAMIVGIVVGLVMRQCSKLSFFKKDSGMPDFIIVWFDSLIPIMALLFLGILLTDILKVDVYELILTLFTPLTGILQSFWGYVLLIFIQTFLYSFGISPWLLTPITYPIFMRALSENAAAIAAGGTASNIALSETTYALVSIGGTGATLSLVALMLVAAKSIKLKAIGKATIVPSLFNINEPVIFGAPIVFNPYLMVGMWVNGIVVSAVAYLSMLVGFVNIPSNPYLLWYVPYPISSFLATGGDWRAVVVCLISFGLSLAIWYPFFKMYDGQLVLEEAAELESEQQLA